MEPKIKYYLCRSAAHCFCGSMDMVKEEDGYCKNELDERLEHMYMWVTEIHVICMNFPFTFQSLPRSDGQIKDSVHPQISD